MGLLKRVLAGIGSYMVKRAEFNEKQALLDLQYRRDLALKQLQMAHDYTLEDKKQANDITKIEKTGEQNRLTAVAQGVVQERVQSADDDRDTKNAILLKGVDFSNEKALKGIEHKYNLVEGAAGDARKLQAELEKAGQTVDHWEVTRGGRLVALNGKGEVLKQSAPGMVNPTRAPSESSGGSVLDAYGGGGAASATAPTGKGGQANQQKALLKAYNSATPQTAPGLFDANGKKKPFDQVMREMNEGR